MGPRAKAVGTETIKTWEGVEPGQGGGVVGKGQLMATEPHVHLRVTEPVVFRKLVLALTRVVAIAVVRNG